MVSNLRLCVNREYIDVDDITSLNVIIYVSKPECYEFILTKYDLNLGKPANSSEKCMKTVRIRMISFNDMKTFSEYFFKYELS